MLLTLLTSTHCKKAPRTEDDAIVFPPGTHVLTYLIGLLCGSPLGLKWDMICPKFCLSLPCLTRERPSRQYIKDLVPIDHKKLSLQWLMYLRALPTHCCALPALSNAIPNTYLRNCYVCVIVLSFVRYSNYPWLLIKYFYLRVISRIMAIIWYHR